MELALAFAGQVNTGRLGQTERLVKFVKAVFTGLGDNLHHCHVARIHQCFGQRLCAVAAGIGTLNRLGPVAYHH